MLGIPDDEKMGMYRCTSAVMQFGEMKFKQRPREEQAEADGSAEAEKVTLLSAVHSSSVINRSMQRIHVFIDCVAGGSPDWSQHSRPSQGPAHPKGQGGVRMGHQRSESGSGKKAHIVAFLVFVTHSFVEIRSSSLAKTQKFEQL